MIDHQQQVVRIPAAMSALANDADTAWHDILFASAGVHVGATA
jgi:hypothetical protein